MSNSGSVKLLLLTRTITYFLRSSAVVSKFLTVYLFLLILTAVSMVIYRIMNFLSQSLQKFEKYYMSYTSFFSLFEHVLHHIFRQWHDFICFSGHKKVNVEDDEKDAFRSTYVSINGDALVKCYGSPYMLAIVIVLALHLGQVGLMLCLFSSNNLNTISTELISIYLFFIIFADLTTRLQTICIYATTWVHTFLVIFW